MSKWFWIILTLVVGGLIGIFALANNTGQTPEAVENPHEIAADDHIRGPDTATVTLVEYGDFQCPACKNAFPLVKQLSRDYPSQLQLVFRHFPLPGHNNAFAAARAAEAAGAQGKFFEMHDLLYENQEQWSSNPSAVSLFRDYASQLGLDIEAFNSAYNSSATGDRINRDIKVGQSIGVSSTPTFYINGEKVEPNPRSYDEFKKQVEAALVE